MVCGCVRRFTVTRPSRCRAARLGFTDEAAGLGYWIRDRVEERAGGEDSPLAIMYRVDGSSDLQEFTLDHFEGYKGSSPVRIGNGAAAPGACRGHVQQAGSDSPPADQPARLAPGPRAGAVST
jgi:hypothetical protein